MQLFRLQAEFFDDDMLGKSGDKSLSPIETSDIFAPPVSMASEPFMDEDKYMENLKKSALVDNLLHGDIVSKSTTESSVTTVVSTLTKSSDEEPKSVLEDATSADFSKISGADLVNDPSKTSMEAKEDSRFEEQIEDRGTPDFSKKSIDLTKDYSKSSIDSKDTSRDFTTNELSKDSTVDLSKDYSKASVESIRETSKSIDEKTFSEDHSSLDVSKTLASDASDGITMSKEFINGERSVSKLVQVSTSSSQETSILTESKIFSEHDDKIRTSEKLDFEKDLIGDMEEKIEELKSEFKKEASLAKDKIVDQARKSEALIVDIPDSIITDLDQKAEIDKPETDVSGVPSDKQKFDKIKEEVETTVTKSAVIAEKIQRDISDKSLKSEKHIVDVPEPINDIKESKTGEPEEVKAIAKRSVDLKEKVDKKQTTDEESVEDLEKEDEVPDMSELNRRCSNLLEEISQGALIRIDSSHVTHGMYYKMGG